MLIYGFLCWCQVVFLNPLVDEIECIIFGIESVNFQRVATLVAFGNFTLVRVFVPVGGQIN